MQNENNKRRRRRKNRIAPAAVLGLVAVLSVGVVACYSMLRDGGMSGDEQIVQPQAATGSQSSQISQTTKVSSQDESIPGEELPVGGEPSESKPVPTDFSFDKDDWRLVLINSTNKLESDYAVELGSIGNYQLDKRIIEDTQAMIAAAKKDGYTLTIYSAYRPMERSRVLYNGKVNEYIAAGYTRDAAEKEAARWIAPPGTSEHNTGLAMDIISGDYFTKFNDLVHEFDTCPEFTWLYEHCAEYGFILRYPKDKQETTGITYEPWHYRYVGREAAKYMMENKLCLEEFWAQ